MGKDGGYISGGYLMMRMSCWGIERDCSEVHVICVARVWPTDWSRIAKSSERTLHEYCVGKLPATEV